MKHFAAKDLTLDAEHAPSIRARLDEETGGQYAAFRQQLSPHHRIVWRDIGLSYAGLVFLLGAVAMASGSAFGLLAAALGAVGVGLTIAYLQLFIHEAAHWGLASNHAKSDRLANIFIAWQVGTSIAAYRRTHFLHHGHFGKTEDTERSYAHRLSWRFVVEMLTGVHAFRVFLARSQTSSSVDSESPSSKRDRLPLLRGLVAHLLLLAVLLSAGAWPAALAWIGGMAIFFPFFATLRPLLEHRATPTDVRHGLAGKDGVTRLFEDGPLARIIGGAGFSRHLLHHWEPNVSYTRLGELEAYLDKTSISPILTARRTTYAAAFRAILTHDSSHGEIR